MCKLHHNYPHPLYILGGLDVENIVQVEDNIDVHTFVRTAQGDKSFSLGEVWRKRKVILLF